MRERKCEYVYVLCLWYVHVDMNVSGVWLCDICVSVVYVHVVYICE